MVGPQSSLLTAAAGEPPRLHLHHGPIDLIIQAWGSDAGDAQVMQAYRSATRCFDSLLQQLVDELVLLRSPLPSAEGPRRGARGPVARRMVDAVLPHTARCFVTPMAAVAGAVADELVSVMWRDAALLRVFVNNGGDIALRLRPGQRLTAAVAASPVGSDGAPGERIHAEGLITLQHADGVQGMATSGWQGRSHSLGIADAVTVLADSAAAADVAATLVANAVDLPGDPRIGRAPASSLAPDSDLGERLVTTAVPALDHNSIELALSSGQQLAQALLDGGQVIAALLRCQGHTRVVGRFASPPGSSLDQHIMEAGNRVICS